MFSNVLTRRVVGSRFLAIPHRYFHIHTTQKCVQIQGNYMRRHFAWSQMKAYFKGEKAGYQQQHAKFGKDSQNPFRADYEKEVQERTQRKLNWGIQNRWEQRELDDIYKNEDIRSVQFRDFTKQLIETRTLDLKEFNSVEEIYYYIDNMFEEGISEPTLCKALDIFIRDADQFKEDDLKHPTFKKLQKEISKNLITFSKEESYVKTAQFMDIFCSTESLMWINLELFVMKKESMFSDRSLIRIMTHFARQLEGSTDFYHFFEFQFDSNRFEKTNLDDFISFGYNFYIVHTGSFSFFKDYAEQLVSRMDETMSTFNILRVLQTFAEIGPKFPDIFELCEYYLLKRYEQLMIEEMVCASACFAIAGHGSKMMFKLFEKQVIANPNIDFRTLRDVCKSFIYSLRGSEELYRVLEPRIRSCLDSFTLSEKCYLLSVFWQKRILSKVFQDELEKSIASRLRETEEITMEELAMIVNVYTTTRACGREFQKLMEFTVLQRLNDIRNNLKLFHFIGSRFETSGFCSIDTMRVLKDQLKIVEAEDAMLS